MLFFIAAKKLPYIFGNTIASSGYDKIIDKNFLKSQIYKNQLIIVWVKLTK